MQVRFSNLARLYIHELDNNFAKLTKKNQRKYYEIENGEDEKVLIDLKLVVKMNHRILRSNKFQIRKK